MGFCGSLKFMINAGLVNLISAGSKVRLETKLPNYVETQVLGIAVETIGEARLIQTEELIRNSLKRGKQAGNSTKPAEAADERGE